METTETDREHGTVTAIAKKGRNDAATWREVSDLIAGKAWPIAGVQMDTGRLDEVFRRITQGDAA